MPENKRYTAINRQSLLLILNLPDDKGQVSIEFKPGYGLRSEGYFLTTNELVQKALESDKRFNKSYRLSEVDGVSSAELQAKAILLGPKTFEFTTVEQAKQWLKENYSVPMIKMVNKKETINRYSELGLSFEITNKN